MEIILPNMTEKEIIPPNNRNYSPKYAWKRKANESIWRWEKGWESPISLQKRRQLRLNWPPPAYKNPTKIQGISLV